MADFDASGQAFLHPFGIVSIQRSGRFGKNLVSARAHRVDHVFILVEVQRRLDSSRLFFVLKDSDQLDRSLPDFFELEQSLRQGHLKECTEDIEPELPLRFSSRAKFTIKLVGRSTKSRFHQIAGSFVDTREFFFNRILFDFVFFCHASGLGRDRNVPATG